jgi:hypothetical protein
MLPDSAMKYIFIYHNILCDVYSFSISVLNLLTKCKCYKLCNMYELKARRKQETEKM